jgi:outer membrane protein assembly factor BamB
MKISELVFIGIKGSVVALNRSTGNQVWATHLKGSAFVNVVLDNGRLYATTYGEVFCIDPLTGEGLWQNPLKGLGLGLATIAAEGITQGASAPVMAEQRREEEEAAAAAS